MNFAHAEVATLDPTTMRTLCEEYIANNYIDPETRCNFQRPLAGCDWTARKTYGTTFRLILRPLAGCDGKNEQK